MIGDQDLVNGVEREVELMMASQFVLDPASASLPLPPQAENQGTLALENTSAWRSGGTSAATDQAGLTGFSVPAHPLPKGRIRDPASTAYEPGISRFLIELYPA